MEILGRLVEGGVLGLAAYILMLVCVLAVARAPIRRRWDSTSESAALVAACGAIAFLVLSTLFDVMAFPHCPYIFMTVAGFLAVAAKPAPEAATGRASLQVVPAPPPGQWPDSPPAVVKEPAWSS
jgi:O-antigen ligase